MRRAPWFQGPEDLGRLGGGLFRRDRDLLGLYIDDFGKFRARPGSDHADGGWLSRRPRSVKSRWR
jgi:hypothetical protein